MSEVEEYEPENELGDENDLEEHEEGNIESIHIQNIVATADLGAVLPLDKISKSAKNAEYNPKRFQSVIIRIREPRSVALIFASGKMIVTGTKTIEDSENAAKKFVSIINKIVTPPVSIKNFKIQNITASVYLGFPIRLEGFLYANPNESTYEPELFPGLIYRMPNSKVVLLIFVSGKTVITGAKKEEDLQTAMENIYDKLDPFFKKNIVVSTKKTS